MCIDRLNPLPSLPESAQTAKDTYQCDDSEKHPDQRVSGEKLDRRLGFVYGPATTSTDFVFRKITRKRCHQAGRRREQCSDPPKVGGIG